MESRIGIENGTLICGRYRVIRGLGRGATGEGFLAQDTLVETDVVCKVGLTAEAATWTTFKAQLAKLRRIRSRDVVQAHDLATHQAESGGPVYPVLVLEAAEGVDLDAWHSGKTLTERLTTCSRVAGALALLHGEGMTHGDLWKGVNVIAAAHRVVLIDPDPELWGPTSGAGERRGDLDALASVIEILLPEHKRLGLTSLLEALRRKDSGCDSATASEQLATTLARIPLADKNLVDAAARSYHQRHDEVDAVYKANRLARALAIEGLAERLRHVCEPFRVKVKVDPATCHDAEARFDVGGMATFVRRVITCFAERQGVSWAFRFEAVEDFYKPRPYHGGVLGLGNIVSFGLGAAEVSHDLEIQRDGDVCDVFAQPKQPPVLVQPPRKRGAIETPAENWERVTEEWLVAQLAHVLGIPRTA